MAAPISIITIYRASIFDRDFLEDGRYIITFNTGPQTLKTDAFVDGIAEVPGLLVSNSILAIRQDKATVDLENLPDNLEFVHQIADVLYFIIKGDCDIPLTEVQNQPMT